MERDSAEMLGSPSQGRQRGHRKDAVASQIYSDEKITICTSVWLWAGGEAGCVLSHKIQICNSHPDPVHCWFPLHCTNLWFTWPQRTRQKFQLCWWSRIPPWEKKNYIEKCYFVTVSMGKTKFPWWFIWTNWAVFLWDHGSYSAELVVKLGGICADILTHQSDI